MNHISQGRSRSINTILASGSSQAGGNNSQRKGSMNNMLEQRRRSTMTKLKGLVIPEIVSENPSSNHSSSSKDKLSKSEKTSESDASSYSGKRWKRGSCDFCVTVIGCKKLSTNYPFAYFLVYNYNNTSKWSHSFLFHHNLISTFWNLAMPLQKSGY